MSEANAHKEAIMRFEESFKDTQQSGEIMDLGLLQQGGPVAKLFTMFMTSQTSYYRGVSAAMRNFHKGKLDAMKRIGVFWFMMPAMFEAIASAPLALGDDDDQELYMKRIGRGVALGPVSGLFWARDAAAAFYNALFLSEESWMSSGISSPVAEPVKVMTNLLHQVRKAMGDGEIDIGQMYEDAEEIASYMTGYPIAQGRKMGQRISEGVKEGNPAKMMGYSDYFTGE